MTRQPYLVSLQGERRFYLSNSIKALFQFVTEHWVWKRYNPKAGTKTIDIYRNPDEPFLR